MDEREYEDYLKTLTDDELLFIRNRIKWEVDRRTKLNHHIKEE